VLVIGRTTRCVSEAEAYGSLAGYTMANDLGDRLLEKRTSQWTTGKLMDTFCPVGPALVTPDAVPDPNNLEIRTWINGRLVQHGNTRQMFFSPPALISYLSHLTTLETGDIILTGSPKRLGEQPAPVLSLQPGDRMVIEIGSLGRLENPVIAERNL
jgi:2-keto-4-pentenoate hydratase/2-oxohepta-3-ene-1,7-dioic acid hydratase in catechol pathway